jgi:hypothetical protein
MGLSARFRRRSKVTSQSLEMLDFPLLLLHHLSDPDVLKKYLGSLHLSWPKDKRSIGDEACIRGGTLIKAREYSSEVIEFVKKTFY